MKELLLLFVGFLLGLLAHIIKGLITDARKRDVLKKAIFNEIQANYFQIRDGKAYSAQQKSSLEMIKNDLIDMNGEKTKTAEGIVILAYKFMHTAFEANVSNLNLLSLEIGEKIYHFYNRLQALEHVAESAIQFFHEAPGIKTKDPRFKIVKPILKDHFDASFYKTMEDYQQFEIEAYNIGAELIRMLGPKSK